MKKIFFTLALIVTAFVQKSYATDSSASQPNQLLKSYLDIKNALVAGNPNIASSKAEEYVNTFKNVDINVINEAARSSLLKHVTDIFKNKNIKQQREHFATLSTGMYALSKAVKLNTQLLYYAWCPMKKAYWLSSESAIKNPYYGSAMLTCGEVTETI